jgi:DNA-binding transcriptional LysR family regulator
MKRKQRSAMTLSQLQIFLTVAEHQSFSEAALQLEISQSSVSSAIATLEADLKVILFSRGRYGAHLTPIGERIIEHARQMIELQNEINKEVNLFRSLQGGRVRLTSFRSATTHLLPSAIAQFHQAFPEIKISISENIDNQSIEEDLHRGRADIGFIDTPLDDEFDTWELSRDEYVVLFPSTFKHTSPYITWKQLTTFPLIMFEEGDKHDEAVYAHCFKFGQRLNVAYHVGADSSIVNMVAQGLGATIMPRLAAEPIPANVQVYSLPIPLFRTIWVVVLANAQLSPQVFAFLEVLKKHRQA